MSPAVHPSERQIAVARVYAQALLSLAEAQGTAEDVLAELDELVTLLDAEPALEGVLSSPLVDSKERGQALDRLFQTEMSQLLLDTLQVMNSKGRAGLTRSLAEAYRQEHEALRNQIRVDVRAAVPLSDGLEQQLQQATTRFTGKEAKLKVTLDESLIGGVVLHVGDRKIDTSVASELRDLEQRLNDRASREIHSGSTSVEGVS